MKSLSRAALYLSLLLPAVSIAQPPEGGPPEGRPSQGGPRGPGDTGETGRPAFGRFPNPLMQALDADRNGELSAEEIENAAVALKSLDKNSDGKLDNAEMRPNFEGMGPGGFGGGFGQPSGEGGRGGNSEEMVNRLLAMDADKDGKLSKSEAPERLQSMFARGDKNEDGFLDKEEILAMARERSGAQGGIPGFGFGGGFGGPGPGGGDFIGQMMDRSDANKDGKLSADELPPFMKERLLQSDTNNDGALDKAELEAVAARMRDGRGREGQAREGRGRGQRPPVEDSEDSSEQKPETDAKP